MIVSQKTQCNECGQELTYWSYMPCDFQYRCIKCNTYYGAYCEECKGKATPVCSCRGKIVPENEIPKKPMNPNGPRILR